MEMNLDLHDENLNKGQKNDNKASLFSPSSISVHTPTFFTAECIACI